MSDSKDSFEMEQTVCMYTCEQKHLDGYVSIYIGLPSLSSQPEQQNGLVFFSLTFFFFTDLNCH